MHDCLVIQVVCPKVHCMKFPAVTLIDVIAPGETSSEIKCVGKLLYNLPVSRLYMSFHHASKFIKNCELCVVFVELRQLNCLISIKATKLFFIKANEG